MGHVWLLDGGFVEDDFEGRVVGDAVGDHCVKRGGGGGDVEEEGTRGLEETGRGSIAGAW